MAEISRVKQKIFAKNADANDLGVVGSKSAGTPDYSTDVATLQSLAQFETGLRSMVTPTDAPYLQDQNSLFYIITSQLAYLFQAGVPAWEAATEYFTGKSYVNYNGRIYVALQDSTNKTPSTETEYWKDILTIENITDLQNELNNKANTALTNLIQGLSNTICTTPATTTSSATNERPAVIVKNWVNGKNWYRIWSDGWCEQGGEIYANNTINFSIAFSNTNYTAYATIYDSSQDEAVAIYNRLTTSMDLKSDRGVLCSWRASGYCTGQTATTLFNQTAIGNGANIVNELYTKTFNGNAVLSIQLGGGHETGNGGELKSTIQVQNGDTIKAVSINGHQNGSNGYGGVGVGILLNNTPILYAGGGARGYTGGSGYKAGLKTGDVSGNTGYDYNGTQVLTFNDWSGYMTSGTACGAPYHTSNGTANGGDGYIASTYSAGTTYTNASNTSGAYIKIYQYL